MKNYTALIADLESKAAPLRERWSQLRQQAEDQRSVWCEAYDPLRKARDRNRLLTDLSAQGRTHLPPLVDIAEMERAAHAEWEKFQALDKEADRAWALYRPLSQQLEPLQKEAELLAEIEAESLPVPVEPAAAELNQIVAEQHAAGQGAFERAAEQTLTEITQQAKTRLGNYTGEL